MEYTHSVSFKVRGSAVSTNGAYHPRKDGKGFYRDYKATNFKEAVKREAFVACVQYGQWPKLETIGPLEIEIEIIAYGGKPDVDAPGKFAQDAMEGIFYIKDKYVGKLIQEVKLGNPDRPYLEIHVRRRNISAIAGL